MPTTVKVQHGGTNDVATFPVNSTGLKRMSETHFHYGNMVITVDVSELNEEARINFVAMWQKAYKHLRFVFGLPSTLPSARTQVWRKFFRNRVDNEHGQGVGYVEFMNRFLRQANLEAVTATETTFSFHGYFSSSVMLAAAVGRLINMMRWCQQWTPSIKLISEANITWETFNKISVNSEQPIVRRRK